MTAPHPDAPPVTRAEFDELRAIVRYMAHSLSGHRHSWSSVDSMTFGPADGVDRDFREILKRLDALEAGDDSDE